MTLPSLPPLPPFLRSFLLSIEISGKESTLHLISSPLARANAEEHIRQLRASLRRLQRSPEL